MKYDELGRILDHYGKQMGYGLLVREYGIYAGKMQDKPWPILGEQRYIDRFARYIRMYKLPRYKSELEHKLR
jgi:hypothetical protein